MYEICERLFEQNGYVKWADVGKALGVSRQAIQLRLRAAQRRGELDDATYERWASLTSRSGTIRQAAHARKLEQERLLVRVRLSPESVAWLRTESVLRKVTSADIINGLIAKEINNS